MRPNPTAQGEACGASVGPALFQCNCAAGFANGMCDLRNDRWHSGRTYTHDAVPEVNTVAVDGVSGMPTHRLPLQLNETAANMHSVYGHGEIPPSMPTPVQVATPFGGVGPALVASDVGPTTVGLTSPSPSPSRFPFHTRVDHHFCQNTLFFKSVQHVIRA